MGCGAAACGQKLGRNDNGLQNSRRQEVLCWAGLKLYSVYSVKTEFFWFYTEKTDHQMVFKSYTIPKTKNHINQNIGSVWFFRFGFKMHGVTYR